MTATGEAVTISGTAGGRSGWRLALLAFLLTSALAALIGVAALLLWDRASEERIADGVTVGGVPVGGLASADAEALLLTTLPDMAAGELTLHIGDAVTRIPYADIDRRYELDGALGAAADADDPSGILERAADRVALAVRGMDIAPAVVYDRAALDRRVDEAVAAGSVQAMDAALRSAADGTWSVRPAVAGRQADASAARSAAAGAVDGAGTSSVAIDIPVTPVAPAVTTEQVQALAASAAVVSATDLSLVAGGLSRTIAVDTLRSWVSLGDDGLSLSFDRPAIQATVATMAGELDVRPVDAGFAFGEQRTIMAVPAQDGSALDVEATVDRVVAALAGRAAGNPIGSVELAVSPVVADFSTADAQAAAPRVVRVSGWTTRFIVNKYNFFGNNISVPTAKMDGLVVAPGRWFDFWKAIGEIREADGYGPGAAILNGRTRPTGVIGGGICSCSTTIFNAALRAGLEMGSRHNHYYYITRYPVGLDATVYRTSSGTGKNMRFRNDTPYPILIRGVNRYGLVRFELYSVPLEREVELTEPVISHRVEARDTVEYTDRLPTGVSRRIEYPTDGFRSWVTRTVRDASGAIIHEETYYSDYAAIDGITLVGR